MKKLFKVAIFFITLTLLPTLVQAFNPIGHICIAEGVFGNCRPKIDLYYCSYFPDLSLFVTNPARWSDAFVDTHYTYIDLRPCARSLTQNACAKGWLTHNLIWGADHYAGYPGSVTGYVEEKANELLSMGLDSRLTLEFAHNAVETAIDLLLENDSPQLGWNLLISNWLRSWEDRHLLVKVLVWKHRRTGWLTLASTELAFRNVVCQYARALVLPSPEDKMALADLSAQLAWELFEIEITPEELLPILEAAIELCRPDYTTAIQDAIDGIRSTITP